MKTQLPTLNWWRVFFSTNHTWTWRKSYDWYRFFPRTPEHELVQLLIWESSGNHASPSSEQPERGMCVNWRPSAWPRKSPQVPEGMTSNKRIHLPIQTSQGGVCIYISLTGNCVLLSKIRTLLGGGGCVFFTSLWQNENLSRCIRHFKMNIYFKYKIMVKLTPSLQVD